VNTGPAHAPAPGATRAWPHGTPAEHLEFLVELYGALPADVELRVPLAVVRAAAAQIRWDSDVRARVDGLLVLCSERDASSEQQHGGGRTAFLTTAEVRDRLRPGARP
jgi:hypothetical protein